MGSGQVVGEVTVVPSPCPPGPHQLWRLWRLRGRKCRQWLGSGGAPPGSHLGVAASPAAAVFTLRESQKDSLGLVAPGRHRTTCLPRGVQEACMWDRQTEGGPGHSQQGEPQLGEGVVDIADGGGGGGVQGAGRQGQAGPRR